MASGISYGSEGAYSEAYQAGGNIAADQAMQSRRRGLGGGGLAAQRQELALMQTQGGAAGVTRALLTGVGTEYANTQQAISTEGQRLIDAAAASATTQANTGSIVAPDSSVTPPSATTPNAPNTAGGILPVNEREAYTMKGSPEGTEIPKKPALGQTFKGSSGIIWIYRSQPKGKGWYKKGSKDPTVASGGVNPPGYVTPPGTTGI